MYIMLFIYLLRKHIFKELPLKVSPYLSFPDFFLWAYLKACVYVNNPHSVDVLKINTEHEIQQIGVLTFRRLATIVIKPFRAYIRGVVQ